MLLNYCSLRSDVCFVCVPLPLYPLINCCCQSVTFDVFLHIIDSCFQIITLRFQTTMDGLHHSIRVYITTEYQKLSFP